jgi:glycine/serine hydroxymethyltransferase
MGLREEDMSELADIINDAILKNQDKETLIERVAKLSAKADNN